jgi:hypothetical protein
MIQLIRKLVSDRWRCGLFLGSALIVATSAPALATTIGLGFNNASLAGSCALSFASIDQSGTSTAVGLLTFDGVGGLTGSLSVNDTGVGDFKDFTAITGGTYSVSVDGTGSATFTLNGKSKTVDFIIDGYTNAGVFELDGIDTKANKPGYLKCHSQNPVTLPTALSLVAAPYGVLFVEDAGGATSTVAVGRIGFTAVSSSGTVVTGTVSGDLASNTSGAPGFTDFQSFTNGTYTFDTSTATGSMTFTIPGRSAPSTLPFVAYTTFSKLRGLDGTTGGVSGVIVATIQR